MEACQCWYLPAQLVAPVRLMSRDCVRFVCRLWQSNLDTVMGLLGLSLEQVQSACLSDPKLLSTDPKQLLLRCQTVSYGCVRLLTNYT